MRSERVMKDVRRWLRLEGVECNFLRGKRHGLFVWNREILLVLELADIRLRGNEKVFRLG